MPYRRGMSAMTTWHSQNALLMVAFLWGLSYLIPPATRIPFSEVFPDTIMKSAIHEMWAWGLLLVVPATLSLAGDIVLRWTHGKAKWAWIAGLSGHYLLSGTYATLAVAAFAQGIMEVHGFPSLHSLGQFATSLSRPALWGLITYYHTTYARLPRPANEEPFNV